MARELSDDAPVVFWTVRAGSLLASDWLESRGEVLPMLLWQPLPKGRQVVANFLRVAAAGDMLDGSAAKESTRRRREDLKQGRSIQIAGYDLSPDIAAGFDRATTRLPDGFGSRVAVLEVGPNPESPVSPALRSLVDGWIEGGVDCSISKVGGPRFWQSQEIETAPELVPASLHFLDELRG